MKPITLYSSDEDQTQLVQVLENLKSIKDMKDEEEDIDEGDTREEIIANLKEAFADLKLFKQGKLETLSLEELLKELEEEEKLSEKYAGKLPDDIANELGNHIKQSRE